MTTAAFALASLIWGGSFLFIKLALDGFTPLGVVTMRLAFGLLFLVAYVRIRRLPVPGTARFWIGGAFLGFIDVALPFFAISWGEQFVESGIASILNSTTPLFTLLLVPLLYRADRLPAVGTAGVVVGFAGVLIVVSGGGVTGTLVGKLSVMLGALAYAFSGILLARYMNAYHFVPVVTVGAASSLLLVGSLALATGQLNFTRAGAVPWASVTTLGLLGTGVAYVLFMHIMRAWGPTRASMITYVIPPIGVLLGTLVRAEPLTWRVLVGGALIGCGVFMSNRRRAVVPPEATAAT